MRRFGTGIFLLGFFVVIYIAQVLSATEPGASPSTGNSQPNDTDKLKLLIEQAGFTNVSKLEKIPSPIRGEMIAVYIQMPNHKPEDVSLGIPVGDISDDKVTLRAGAFNETMDLIAAYYGEEQDHASTILLVSGQRLKRALIALYDASPEFVGKTKAEIKFLDVGKDIQLNFVLKRPVENSTAGNIASSKPVTSKDESQLIISTNEWAEVLKAKMATADPNFKMTANFLAMEVVKIESDSNRADLNSLLSAARLLRPGGSAEDATSDKKIRQAIKCNLLEWYASELAKPFTSDFEVKHWASLRQVNYEARQTLLASHQKDVIRSWENLQTAAAIVGLPKVSLEP